MYQEYYISIRVKGAEKLLRVYKCAKYNVLGIYASAEWKGMKCIYLRQCKQMRIL